MSTAELSAFESPFGHNREILRGCFLRIEQYHSTLFGGLSSFGVSLLEVLVIYHREQTKLGNRWTEIGRSLGVSGRAARDKHRHIANRERTGMCIISKSMSTMPH